DATVVLDDRPVLRNVSLELPPGLTLLRGPNGAGKTTLLRAMAGLVPLARGRRHTPSSLLYVGHRPMLLRGLSPRANLAFFGSFRGRTIDTNELLRRWGLQDVAGLPVERLSPGQPKTASLTFAGLLVLLESLAFGPGRAREPDVASAAFWIAVTFAAILVATRSFDRELEDDAIDGVLALPGGRDALYAGKVVALIVVL